MVLGGDLATAFRKDRNMKNTNVLQVTHFGVSVSSAYGKLFVISSLTLFSKEKYIILATAQHRDLIVCLSLSSALLFKFRNLALSLLSILFC